VKLDMETRVVNDVSVLCCRGRFIYREEATAFSEKFAGLLTQRRKIVVDLSELQALDSAGLGELVVAHMWARASGCSLKVVGASSRILQLFELTNLASVFDLYPTFDAALASFQRPIANAAAAVNAA